MRRIADLRGGVPPELRDPTLSRFNGTPPPSLKRSLTRDLPDFRDTLVLFDDHQRRLEWMDELLDRYGDEGDSDQIQSTCAISFKKPSHFALDETGAMALDETDFMYDEEIVTSVADWYKKFDDGQYEEESLSIPRGKNTGWPFFISGSDRTASDLILYITAKYVTSRQQAGYSLFDIRSELRPYYGEPILAYGERMQHTPKDIPLNTNRGWQISNAFEPRVRAILMAPKIDLIYNRQPVKRVLHMIKNHPVHTQDRPTIVKRISDMQSRFKHVVAVDHSGFDRRHGGRRGLQLIKALERLGGVGNGSFTTEFMTKALVPYMDAIYETTPGNTLYSGISTTTLVGCIGNLCSAVAALGHLTGQGPGQVIESFGKTWDLLAWGDDSVLGSDFSIQELSSSYEKFALKVDQEKITKYLGDYYQQGVRPYPVYRVLQTSLFPERPKLDKDVRVISLYAKRLRMKDDKLFTTIGTSIEKSGLFPSPGLVEAWSSASTASIQDIQSTVLRLSKKMASRGDLDAILYSLGSGDDLAGMEVLGLDEETIAGYMKNTSLEELAAEFGHIRVEESTLVNSSLVEDLIKSVKL